VEEGNTQVNTLIGKSMNEKNAQKDNEASPPKEAEKAAKTHEGIPKIAKENSLDGYQRVEENTEKDSQNVDEETPEIVELLASNMSREETAQDEPMMLWKMLQLLKKLKQLIRMLKVLSRLNYLLIKILIKMLLMNLLCQ